MSPSEPRATRHRLTVEVGEPGLHVLVLDAGGAVVARSDDAPARIERTLGRGLYLLRTSLGGRFDEQPIVLDDDRSVEARPPGQYSAAPLPRARTTHEYYAYSSLELGRRRTAPDVEWNGPAEAGFFLFVRAPNDRHGIRDDLLAGISLRTLEGETLTDFRHDAVRDTPAGWAGYSVAASPGMLILHDETEPPRQVPVPLFLGRQTRMFVMHAGRRLWDGLRVSTVASDTLRGGSPYDPSTPEVAAVMAAERGFFALQHAEYAYARPLVDAFLEGSLEDPLVDLMGAYAHLLSLARGARAASARVDERDPVPTALDERTLGALERVASISHLAADVLALHVLAKGPVVWTTASTEGVPLFVDGASALSTGPGLHAPRDSLLARVSSHLYTDSAWTTWHPDALRRIGPGHALFFGLQGKATVGDTPLDQTMVVQLQFIREHIVSADAFESPSVSVRIVYPKVKRAVGEVARVSPRDVSADMRLSALIEPEDALARYLLVRRLRRALRPHELLLDPEQLREAETVRDLVHLVVAGCGRGGLPVRGSGSDGGSADPGT